MLSRFSALVVMLCLSARIAAAQAPILAPDIRVGDTWKYRILDGFTHETQGEATHRVVEVSDREITVQVGNNKNDKSALRYFNREWNAVDSGDIKYDPYYPEFKLPLTVGMTWKDKYSTSGTDGASYSGYVTAKVASLEKVTVPAGTFDAYRIEREVESRSENANSIVTKSQITTWYAPAARRFVRRQVTVSRDGRVRNKSEDELLEYGAASASGAGAH